MRYIVNRLFLKEINITIYVSMEVHMIKRSENYKNYVKEAKSRLSGNRETLGSEVYYLNSHKLTQEEINRINIIACEVAESEEYIGNPLGKLIKEDEFYSLSEEAKLKYILDLSEIYLKIKKKYAK